VMVATIEVAGSSVSGEKYAKISKVVNIILSHR
jgi:hypothetical protein